MEPKELSPMQCKECGWWLATSYPCSFCAALPTIRAALPDNFEQSLHMMPPKVPPYTYLTAVGMNPVFVPWGAVCVQDTLFRTNIATSHLEYYFFKYIWQAAQSTGTQRKRCFTCIDGFRVMEQALLRQVAINEEGRQRAAKEAKRVKEAEAVNVCRACNFPYFKLVRASMNQEHNDICSPSTPDSFNNLNLCGSCIDRLRTGPLFENFLQVMLDDAYSRDVIKRRGNT